jgi:putative flippase GtrA
VIGLAVGPMLIQHVWHLDTLLAQFLLVTSSVMVNFVCRKFFVFKG